MSGGPRAGDCADASLEKYLIPTVTVPPSNTKKGVSPRLARVVPASTNRRTGVDVRLGGALRPGPTDTSNAPSLTITAVDLSAAVGGYSLTRQQQQWVDQSAAKGYFGTRGLADIFLGVLEQTAPRSHGQTYAKVPRFGVSRTQYERNEITGPINDGDTPMGVTMNFDRWHGGNSLDEIEAAPGGRAGTWTVWGQPRLMEDKNGRMLLWYIAKSGTDYDLAVYAFDPRSSTHFEYLTSYYESQGEYIADAVQSSAWIPGGYPFGIAPVTLDDGIYCVMCLTSTTGVGYLYSFELSGTTLGIVRQTATSGSSSRTALGVEIGDVFTNGTDEEGSPSLSDPLKHFGGMDAVEEDGSVKVAIGIKCPDYCSIDNSRTVVYAQTADFVSWGEETAIRTLHIGPYPDLISIGGFSRVSNLQFNAIYNLTGDTLIGVGPSGAVYKSTDGGVGWTRKISGIEPEYMANGYSIDLYAVSGDGVSTIYAGGAFGTMIKSTDSGETWSVCRRSIPVDRFLYARTGLGASSSYVLEGSGTNIEDQHIRGIAVKSTDANSVWCCGDTGFIDYSSTGGTTDVSSSAWARIVQFAGSNGTRFGAYRTILYDADNTIIAAGDASVHSSQDNSDASTRNTLAIRIENATSAKAWNSADIDFMLSASASNTDNTRPDGRPIVKVKKSLSGGIIAAIDDMGHVFKYSASPSPRFTFHHRINAIGETLRVSDFEMITAAQAQVVATRRGADESSLFKTSYFDQAIPVYRRISLNLSSATSLWAKDKDIAAVGGDGAVAANTILHQRARPKLVRLPTGKTMLIVQNLEQGYLEHFEFNGSRMPTKVGTIGVFKNSQLFSAGSFATGASLSTVAMPCVIVDESGSVQVSQYTGYEDSGGVSIDDRKTALPSTGYSTWESSDSNAIFMPLGEMPYLATGYDTTVSGMAFKTRDMKAFSRGRVFSIVVKSDLSSIGVFASRNFQIATDENPTVYVPILPGKYQWCGIDDIMVRFSGFPLNGDSFTVEPIWSYQPSNLVIESPSVYWRGPAVNSGSVAEAILIWDRQDDAIEQQIGIGNTWDASAVALFGTNFSTFYFGLYDASGSLMTETSITQSLAAGTAVGPSGGHISSAILDTSANMIPSQYKLGAGKTFYLKVTSGGNNGKVFRIIDNGRNSIVIENNTTLGSSFSYLIFGDRLFADLTSAMTDSQKYQARYIRITIPLQQTVDRYFKIGTAIIGNYVSYAPHTGNESRRRFSEGFGWRPIPSSVLQRGDSGVSSIEHIGFQRAWTLPYEQIQWWDRDMQMNGLMPAMRQAFAIMFNGNDTETAPNSLYLVRLNDGPETTNTYQDRYSYTMQLEEVV